MGRRESPVDPAAGPVPRFAYALRKLRQEAGGPTYRDLARRAHFSVTALSQAAAGEQLPSLQVALAYAVACGGDPGEWERRWKEADQQVRDAAARADDDTEPPYQGLARFEPDDHDRYFGRDRLVTALRHLVHDRRFTAVFGPSGSGKSSLLRAGLIPTLRAEPDLAAIRVLTPGAHPAHTHAEVLRPVGVGVGEGAGAGEKAGTGRGGEAGAGQGGGEDASEGPGAGAGRGLVEAVGEDVGEGPGGRRGEDMGEGPCGRPGEDAGAHPARTHADALRPAGMGKGAGAGRGVVEEAGGNAGEDEAEKPGEWFGENAGEDAGGKRSEWPGEKAGEDAGGKRSEKAGQGVGGPSGDTLVVVDQFEEVFTLCRDPEERRAFVDLLLAARDPGSRLRVVIAVRADFYGRCAEHRGLADALGEAGLLVGPMDPAELREVIVRPAQRAGYIVERALTARLVEEMTDEPGGLPLLSHVLRETWRRRRGRALTEEAYEAAGGVHGAIAQSAEEVWADLSADHAELARLVLLRLVTPGEGSPDTRRPVDRAELDFTGPWGGVRSPGAAEAPADPTRPAPTGAADISLVLDRLARARLVTLDHGTVDLAHEALITAWPRLSGWIDREREQLRTHRRLTEAARTWDDLGRDPGALYRGTRLATAREQLAGASLTPSERAFLTASGAARRGERRRRRGLVGVLATLLVLALVAGATAWQQSRTSDRRQVEAEARRVAAVADGMRFSDPRTAMRLSVAAARLADTTETRSALIGAMAQRDEDVFAVPGADAGFDGSGDDVHQLTADGRSVVSVTADRVRIWDLRTRRLTLSAPGPGSLMDGVPAAVGPDGRTLALLAGDRVDLWDVRAGRVTRTLSGVDAMQTPFAFTGRTLVAVDWEDGGVHAWDPRTGRPALRIPAPDTEVDGVAASPDGRWLALCTGGDALELWDLAHRRRVSAPWVAKARAARCRDHAMAFTPDSRTLTLATADGVHGWDLTTGRAGPALKADGLTQVWPGGDGTFLVATGPHRLLVWRADHPEVPVLSRRIDADEWDAVAYDRTAGAVRYLGGSATVVRSLSLGTATTARRQQPTAYRSALSDDGRVLARSVESGGKRRTQVLDTRTGRVLFQAPEQPCAGRDSCVDLMALSGDGGYLATGRDPYTHDAGATAPDRTRITVWDLRTGRAHATAVVGAERGGSPGVQGLALDIHARTLLVYRSLQRPVVEVWDVARQQRVRTVRSVRADGSVTSGSEGESLALRPDGGGLVTQGGLVADLRAGRMEPRVLGEDLVTTAAYGPDGSRLAVGDVLGRVTLWDGTARTRLGVLDGSTSDPTTDTTGAVTALAFSPDGRTLAVAGATGTLHLWDLASQRLLGTALPTPGDEIHALAFGPDGTLYASGVHFPVQRWDLDPARLIGEVCERAGSGLSEAAWKTYLPDLPYRRTC